MVNPEKQIFHCFGCHVGGDVFKFVMQLEALSFPESIEKLAERAGVRLDKNERPQTDADRVRHQVRAVLEFAKEHYHGLLLKSKEAAEARAYLKKRGIHAEQAKAWGLGFAPKAGGFVAAAEKKGFAVPVLIKAGLAAERNGRTRDYFWDRVLFPIENAKGEILGFGARTMGDGLPKYLNSPETPVFSKGRVLYGLHAALPAVRKERKALLLEGYMDVIALHQFGFTNACAPLGTALTEDHVRHLKRYVETVSIVFDADAAGAKAALRGAEIVLSQGIGVKVVTLPGGKDPDDLLRGEGEEAFQQALDAAQDLPAFKTEMLLAAGGGRMTAEDKARIAREVLQTIVKAPDEVLKSEWLRALAERLEVDEQSVRRQMQKNAPKELGRARRMPTPAAPATASPLPIVERDVLFYLFKLPSLAVDDELVAESDFGDARAREILATLRKVLNASQEHDAWSSKLLEELSDEAAALTREILCDERESRDPAQVVARLVGRKRKERRFRELEPLVLRRDEGGPPVDPEVRQEYTRLLSELKGSRKGE
jgi:DNA primase